MNRRSNCSLGKKLEKLYSDNARRFLSEEWEKVFAEDVCFSLDTREDAGIAFLNFLGEHTVISRDVEKAKEYFDKSLEAPMCVYCKSDTCHEVYLRLALHYYFMGEKEKVAEAFEIVRKGRAVKLTFWLRL